MESPATFTKCQQQTSPSPRHLQTDLRAHCALALFLRLINKGLVSVPGGGGLILDPVTTDYPPSPPHPPSPTYLL
ncbi:hypothetical protein J6590_022540 [Homalodisca vitripennis]|nr:hypothetical protein J6590_022540 [Homalodisca vitripennis]